MGKYRIAGISIEFNYCYEEFFNKRIKKYQIDDSEAVNCLMNVEIVEKIDKPQAKEDFRHLNRIVYSLENNRKLIGFYDKNFENINAFIEYTEDYSHVLIKLKQSSLFNMAEYEYIITGIIFLTLAIRNQHIPIHASAIAYNNEGILFSAPSTTGKSTHAALWKHLIEGVTIINDDKPLLVFDDQLVSVVGSPWSGKSIFNANVKVPLKAIVFLRQNKNNFIQEIDFNQKLTHLMRNVYRPTEEDLLNVIFDKLNILIKNIPMYILHCNIEDDAVWTIFNKLFKETNYES